MVVPEYKPESFKFHSGGKRKTVYIFEKGKWSDTTCIWGKSTVASAQELGSERGKDTCQEKGAASSCLGQQPQRPAHHTYLRDADEDIAYMYRADKNERRMSHVSIFTLASRKLRAPICGTLPGSIQEFQEAFYVFILPCLSSPTLTFL